MFNSLTGTVTGKYPQKLFLDTHGIEWDLNVPDTTLDKIADVGSEARVYTWMQHTDALMLLYGFASESDRRLFLDLLKVDGIGPKGALKIMSNVTAEQLASVLEEGNLAVLEKIPGVGKKTAGKMLLQLKGKLSLENTETVVIRKNAAVPFSDVVSALTDMGYERKQAEQKVAEIASSFESDEKFKTLPDKEKEDAVFRRAIVELAQ